MSGSAQVAEQLASAAGVVAFTRTCLATAIECGKPAVTLNVVAATESGSFCGLDIAVVTFDDGLHLL